LHLLDRLHQNQVKQIDLYVNLEENLSQIEINNTPIDIDILSKKQ
jgi:hypothetical protein